VKISNSRALVMAANSAVVSAYKGLGFVILTVILFAICSYLSVQGYFLVARSWVAPVIVQPNDPRVLAARTQLAAQQATRDKLLAERRELLSRRALSDRSTEVLEGFQDRFGAALLADVRARRAELAQLSSLRSELAAAREELRRSSGDFATVIRAETRELFDAKLLDREGRIRADYHLSQLELGNLSLAERDAALETRIRVLQREIAEREALRAGAGRAAGNVGWDALMIEREFARGALEIEGLRAERAVAQAALEALEVNLARQEGILSALEASPYAKAAERGLALGFVPYENLSNVAEGTPLYRCALGLLWCSPAGSVSRLIEGEVTVPHPVRRRDLRGVMAELALGELRWAEETILYVGRPPLFF
jgi:hypothetical protein